MTNKTKDYYDQIEVYNTGFEILFYSVLVFMPIGVISNAITFFIYYTKELRKRHTVSYWYCAKAFIDTLYLCIMLGYFVQCISSPWSLSTSACQFIFLFIYTLPNISSFISVMASVDRLRVIGDVSRFAFMNRIGFFYVAILIICIVCFGVYLPIGVNFDFYWIICYAKSSDLQFAYDWFSIAFSSLLPLIILIVLSSMIMHISIRKGPQIRKVSSSNTDLDVFEEFYTDKTLTSNILGINLLYISTTLIQVIGSILKTVAYGNYSNFYDHNWSLFYLILYICDSIYLINLSCQMFVHLVTNEQFFKIFKTCGCGSNSDSELSRKSSKVQKIETEKELDIDIH